MKRSANMSEEMAIWTWWICPAGGAGTGREKRSMADCDWIAAGGRAEDFFIFAGYCQRSILKVKSVLMRLKSESRVTMKKERIEKKQRVKQKRLILFLQESHNFWEKKHSSFHRQNRWWFIVVFLKVCLTLLEKLEPITLRKKNGDWKVIRLFMHPEIVSKIHWIMISEQKKNFPMKGWLWMNLSNI